MSTQSNSEYKGVDSTDAPRSVWREFEFVFIVVRNAIIPTVTIMDLIQNWSRIKKRLAEGTRKRLIQSTSIQQLL